MAFPVDRPRRLRSSAPLRRLVAETRLSPADFILPVFVKEGISERAPIASMPGVFQHTLDSVRKAAVEAVAAGVGGLIVFGVPSVKDDRGSQADTVDGIGQKTLAALVSEVGGDAVVMSDLCLD